MDTSDIILKNINKAEAARYLGYKDTLPDVNMTKLILQAEMEILKVIKPRYCYKVFDIDVLEDGVNLVGAELTLKGHSIANHLKDCDKAVVMCATLSGDVDKLMRRTEPTGMVNVLIMDALANAAIEQVCDEVEKIFLKDFQEYNNTWRFGVGYGDFPLTTQKQLLETLDAGKRIGVCTNENSLLTPLKSVTCVVGLSKKTVENKKSCDNCNLKETCNFRKNGTQCSK